MRCAPRAARVASAPQAAARRPARGHRGPRCPRSPSLPPLSIAAASFHLPQEISRAYGPEACKLLPINSRAAGAPPLPDLWTGARPPEINPSADAPPPPAAEELGALLSDADMEQARTPAPDPDPGPRRWTLTRMLDPSPDPGPGPGPEPYPRPRSRPRTRARAGAEQVRKLVAGPLAKLALGHLQQRVVQISATVKASRQGVKNMVRSARGVGGRASHARVPVVVPVAMQGHAHGHVLARHDAWPCAACRMLAIMCVAWWPWCMCWRVLMCMVIVHGACVSHADALLARRQERARERAARPLGLLRGGGGRRRATLHGEHHRGPAAPG